MRFRDLGHVRRRPAHQPQLQPPSRSVRFAVASRDDDGQRRVIVHLLAVPGVW